MLETLINLDRQLFFYINYRWQNPVLDLLAPILREPYTWAPLYLFLLLFTLLNFGLRGLWWCMIFLVAFGISDQTGSFIKNAVGRLRPCHDPAVASYMRLLNSFCPGSGSFISNHACNHFTLGMFCFMTLRPYFGKYSWLFLVWAAAISYSQVYVGVHYPLDVIGGGIVGTLIGWVCGSFFERRIRLIQETAI